MRDEMSDLLTERRLTRRTLLGGSAAALAIPGLLHARPDEAAAAAVAAQAEAVEGVHERAEGVPQLVGRHRQEVVLRLARPPQLSQHGFALLLGVLPAGDLARQVRDPLVKGEELADGRLLRD